jgi:hypothetical protein
MAKSVSGIEAALLEAQGLGGFSVSGKALKFRHGPYTTTWWFGSQAEAERNLRVFRAAPKYMVAA